MFSALIDLALKSGIAPKWAAPAVYAVLALLSVGVFFGAKAIYDRNVVAHHEQKIERRAAPATNTAAGERANDAIANAKHEEELHNAIHSVPDAAPAGPSHALACERLRKRGNAPASCR